MIKTSRLDESSWGAYTKVNKISNGAIISIKLFLNTLIYLNSIYQSILNAKKTVPWEPSEAKPVEYVTRYEMSRAERVFDPILQKLRDTDKVCSIQVTKFDGIHMKTCCCFVSMRINRRRKLKLQHLRIISKL
jgi:hypothetical protein